MRCDASAYPDFIKANDLQKGIIVNDKGFPPDAIADELKNRPDLHYFTPIKRDDKRISKYNRKEGAFGVIVFESDTDLPTFS